MQTNSPRPTAQPENKGSAFWFIAFIVFIVATFLSAFDDGGGSGGSDPCSNDVLDAPYETGSEYWDRDQAGERAMACINNRLDNFGE